MSFLKRFSRLTLSQVWAIISRPAMFPMFLTLRRGVTISEIARQFYQVVGSEKIELLRKEFIGNERFFGELNTKLVKYRGRRTNCEGWPELLYVLVRLARPSVVVETGVFDGISSAVILQALEDNRDGKLISIDLPAPSTIQESTHRMRETKLPSGCQPGWAIPDNLRQRHELILGDSKTVLPKVLAKERMIDIFLHDSLHTYEYQKFEYEMAWPKVKEGGLLLSDDVLWTPAFHRFSKKIGCPYKVYCGFGAIKK